MSDEQKTNDENVATMEPETAVDEPNDESQPCEADLSDVEAKHYAAILELGEKVRLLESERDATKEAASAAKKRWEAASEELSELIVAGPNPQRTLNFGDKPLDVPPPEEWRALPIDTLDIAAKLLDKLQDVGINTLGDFCDWQNNHGDAWYQDIKGIGEAAATRISDAWEAFWASLPAEDEATEGRRVRLLVDIDGVGKAGDTFDVDHEEIADAENVGIVVESDVAGIESTTLILKAGEFEYVD